MGRQSAGCGGWGKIAVLKIFRVPERLFAVAMWVVSLVFAGFLLSLGNLVIGDLPLASPPPSLTAFIDPVRLAQTQAQERALAARLDALAPRADAAELRATTARREYDAARERYDNWLSTRQATTDPAQDPEVIARTRELDTLSSSARDAEKAGEAVAADRLAIEAAQRTNSERRSALEDGARGSYDAAVFRSELIVFGLRLAVTLPLLVVAGWLVLRKRKSDYWPLMRGFVLFAVYAFFFELVPYLPSWGGYVRTIVGIVLTLIAGHYAIRWMRTYLATRAVVEQTAEVERKKSIVYEDALKKMSSGVCPGCERTVATTGDVLADYCVHCGMNLFDHCGACASRKLAFFRYCMKCGTSAGAAKEPLAAA